MKIPSSSSAFLLVAAIIVIFVLPTTNADNLPNGTFYKGNFNNTIDGLVGFSCDHKPDHGPYTFESKYVGLTWVFTVPESNKTQTYKCTATWNDKKAELVVYDASFTDKKKCQAPPVLTRNLCSWAATPEGIYFSAVETSYPVIDDSWIAVKSGGLS
ncbi:hypothetical protein POM88_015954 [Heracleum sosnowskyi]|uniref:S-protein homolog n=1 Tax=Heracleum sosnowskyi TaxID=360622 RepID=A0AAD8IMX9_9APIA|nr:hypothetical protein POM88_015954 [Heracleum sosnowskyi]